MTKLYYMVSQDSSGKVRWLLNELNLPYEDVKVSYRNGDLATPEFLAKNPIGQVPVFEDGDLTLFESHAIVTYLSDKHWAKGICPNPANTEERAQYYQWMFFIGNIAEDFFTRYFKLSDMSEQYRNDWGDYTKDKVQKIMQTVEKQLMKQDYILGTFSTVDICMAGALDMVSEETFFNDYPKAKSYYERLLKREACLKSEMFKRN
jgi:glutathione S-transferase